MKHFTIFILLTMFLSSKSADTVMVPIIFKGNSIVATSDLEKVVGVKKPSPFAFWKDKTAKVNTILRPKLKETFQLFYRNEGFYDANISSEFTSNGIVVTIHENRPILISDIEIVSDLDLLESITLEKGSRFRAKDFGETKQNIRRLLLSKGYCSPELKTKAYLDLEKYTALIKIDLEKRKVCHFGKVTVKTESPTMSKDIILSRLQFEEGDIFDIKKIQESYNSLYNLESFDQLTLDYSRNLYNKKPVDIIFKEIKNRIHTRMGLGYATDLKFQGKFHWEYRNFRGNGKKLIFDTLVSDRQKSVENRLYVPYIWSLFDYHLDFLNSVGYSEERNIHDFDEKVFFEKFFFSHRNSEWYNSLGLGIENREISNSVSFNENFFLIYPFMKIIYDKRDSKLNPKNGFYFSHEMEYGLPYSPDSTSYLKYEEELRFIYTLSDVTLSTVGRVGSIQLYNNNMPESKKFFGGGAFSNRGYGYDKIGITESAIDDSESGGFTLANLSLEANFPIYKSFRGAIFTDNTMISDNQGIWEFSNKVITSAGIGFRYLTPIGPFKIDMGVNVHNRHERAFHFQVGQSF